MTMPLDEKGYDAATQALLNAFPMADKIAAMYAEIVLSAYLSAVALPDELEVEWKEGGSLNRLIRALRAPTKAFGVPPVVALSPQFATEAADALSQAHSTIAALRAEVEHWRGEARRLLKSGQEALDAAETAEAEVKHLTEEKEALRGVMEFYAKPENYKGAFVPGGYTEHGTYAMAHHVNAVRKDAGEKARLALSGSKE